MIVLVNNESGRMPAVSVKQSEAMLLSSAVHMYPAAMLPHVSCSAVGYTDPLGGSLPHQKSSLPNKTFCVEGGSPSADAEAPDISGATAPENLLAQYQVCKQQLCFTISAQAPLPRVFVTSCAEERR